MCAIRFNQELFKDADAMNLKNSVQATENTESVRVCPPFAASPKR